MSLSKLIFINQVLNNEVFQLGNEQNPCVIRFGPSKLFDQDKANKTIKIITGDEEFKVFKNVDDKEIVNHKIVHQYDDMEHINVKVNSDTKMTHMSGGTASIEDLTPEQECMLIVKARKWKMEPDKTGFSLKCLAIRLVTREMNFEFI